MNDVPALDIKDLHKTFGQNEVLKGISLAAHKGDVISIIGSSGSGKSTFLRCINLLETPTAGEIWVNGELIQMKNNRAGESVPANEKQRARAEYYNERRKANARMKSFTKEEALRTIRKNYKQAPKG